MFASASDFQGKFDLCIWLMVDVYSSNVCRLDHIAVLRIQLFPQYSNQYLEFNLVMMLFLFIFYVMLPHVFIIIESSLSNCFGSSISDGNLASSLMAQVGTEPSWCAGTR